jgi:hypothetical protein
VVGSTKDDRKARRAGLLVSGEFDVEDADTALSNSGCHVALIASLTPETFSFTLSSALRIGMFPAVFDLGAPPGRSRKVGWGEILPLSMMRDAPALNDHLLSLKLPPVPDSLKTGQAFESYLSLVSDYYGYFSGGSLPAGRTVSR